MGIHQVVAIVVHAVADLRVAVGYAQIAIAGIADAIIIRIILASVDDLRTIVAGIPDPVFVLVRLQAVGGAVTVAVIKALVRDPVAVVVDPIADLLRGLGGIAVSQPIWTTAASPLTGPHVVAERADRGELQIDGLLGALAEPLLEDALTEDLTLAVRLRLTEVAGRTRALSVTLRTAEGTLLTVIDTGGHAVTTLAVHVLRARHT